MKERKDGIGVVYASRERKSVLHNEREVMTQIKNIQYIFILSRSDFIEEKLE